MEAKGRRRCMTSFVRRTHTKPEFVRVVGLRSALERKETFVQTLYECVHCMVESTDGQGS